MFTSRVLMYTHERGIQNGALIAGDSLSTFNWSENVLPETGEIESFE